MVREISIPCTVDNVSCQSVCRIPAAAVVVVVVVVVVRVRL